MPYTRKEALLLLKYAVVSHIDAYWGAGDRHLKALEVLIALDPEDQRLEALYDRLKRRSEAYEGPPEGKDESVYRAEGGEEADAYLEEVRQRFGKEFADTLWDFLWEYF